MRGYLDVLTSNLRALLRFSGRTTPSSFWPYAGTALAASIAAFFLPAFLGLSQAMTKFAAEHPDQAIVTSTPTSYSVIVEGYHSELEPDYAVFLLIFACMVAALVALLAAAVARRLHDTGKSGWWGVLPLPFLLFSLAMFALPVSDSPNTNLDMFIFASNALYLLGLGVLIFLLGERGQPDANRFGPVPPSRKFDP
jgi:uncharacterized membrane protein YhaH (DUF805 family)